MWFQGSSASMQTIWSHLNDPSRFSFVWQIAIALLLAVNQINKMVSFLSAGITSPFHYIEIGPTLSPMSLLPIPLTLVSCAPTCRSVCLVDQCTCVRKKRQAPHRPLHDIWPWGKRAMNWRHCRLSTVAELNPCWVGLEIRDSPVSTTRATLAII